MASPSSNRIVGRSAFWQRNGPRRISMMDRTVNLGRLAGARVLVFFSFLSDRIVNGLFGCSSIMKGREVGFASLLY